MEPSRLGRRMLSRSRARRRHELSATGLSLFSALLFVTTIAATGCDDGTNPVDDGDDDEPSPDLPALVQVGSEGDLRVAFAPGDTMFVDYSSVMGHWAIPGDSLAIEQGSIYVDSGAQRFGDFQLAITTPLVRIAGSHFAAGAWFVNAGPSRITIDVIPDADGGGTPGVAAIYIENGFPSGDSTFVWSDFIDPGPGAPEWIAFASFGYRTLEIVVQHHSLALRDLAAVVDLDAQLVQAGAAGVTVEGSPYPGSGERGAMTCRWLDANSSAALDPTDAFSYSRHHWWVAGPGPDRGFVLSRDWSLENYFENRDPLIAVGGELVFAGLQWSAARRDGATWSVEAPGVFVVGTGAVYIHELR